jgi:hypothetical protein
MEPHPRQKHPTQLGLIDLFTMIGFVIPTFAAIVGVRHSGGGTFAYVLALPIGIGLSILIATVQWRLGKIIWIRFRKTSKSLRNAVGILLFVLQLLWILIGLLSGTKAGVIVAQHLAR